MKTHCTSQISIKLASALVLTLIVLMLAKSPIFMGAVEGISESEKYVHNFVDTPPFGNWTLVQKPMFPVYLNNSQIPIGSNWTVVYPLTANHTYHTYCYGEWIDYGSNPSTDYDIYVYNPLGELESSHTESAGLPEHLGTTVDDPFFVPKYSGNYSFVIRNDPRESNSSQQATLMTIENVESNKWHEAFMEGKDNNVPIFNTSWAFEFFTESQHIEIWIEVPETLDMYEARLYLMANPEAGMGETLNDAPLAWEQGLYGEISGIYGGYNLESTEYRGLASASCEFHGQDMLINYTSAVSGKNLYHLVLIGEKGAGKTRFLVKTEFGNAGLKLINPPLRVYPDNETTLTFVSNITDLRNASLCYSVNDWENSTALSMQLIDNRTCVTVVPRQPAGTTVRYEVEAPDVLENILAYNGSYSVKYNSQLNLTLKAEAIFIGENITSTGIVNPAGENLSLTLLYTSKNGTFKQIVSTSVNGTFAASFKPSVEGEWIVQAMFEGSNKNYPSSSSSLRFRVETPSFLSQYSMYIFAGAGVGVAVIGFVFVKKRRG